jgi:agmatine deiminase
MLSPTELGYHMPAEWEPHEAIWLSWPQRRDTWPDAFEDVPPIFVQIARLIAESELVRINVDNPVMAKGVKYQLETAGTNMEAVRFHYNPTNDAWVRDHGPIYVVRDRDGIRERAILDWDYNAWGVKYEDYQRDNLIPSRIADEFQETRFQPGMILEGGSIDVNGCGTILTTEACLLNPNRNPSLTKQQIEERLQQNLNVSHFIWLGDGIEGDDTDGHVDDMTRFVSEDTIVTIVESNPDDINYRALRENRERLQGVTDQDGRPLRIIDLPMPDPLVVEGIRLPASYANFLICNTIVLVPTYRSPKQDGEAIEILQSLFPTRRVVGLDCTALVWGLGSIHCVTQQQPKVGRIG